MSSTERRALYLLLIAGTIFRLFYVLWLHPPESAVFSDMKAYRDVAVLEAQGSTHPDIAAWHSFSTHLLALCFRLLGGPTTYAFLQCAATIVSLLLGARLAIRVLPPKLALLAVGFQASDCIVVSFSGNYMGETFAQLFFMLTLTFLEKWHRLEKWAYLIPAGFCLGLAGMSREYVLLSSVPIALWVVLVHSGRPGRRLLAVVLLAVCSFAPLVPHMFRNAAITGSYEMGTSRRARYLAYGWSGVRTQLSLGSKSAWRATIYPGDSGVLSAPWDFTEELHRPVTEDQDYWRAVLRTEIQQNPQIVFEKLLHPVYAWAIPAWPSRKAEGWMGKGVAATQLILLFGALPLYMIQLRDGFRRDQPGLLLLNLSVLGLWVTTYLGHGQGSYRVPYEMVFWILALNGVSTVSRCGKAVAVPLTLSVVGLAALCWSLRPSPNPAPLRSLSLKGEVLYVAGQRLSARGQPVSSLFEVMDPMVAEWSEKAYPHAWHYRNGEQRLRIDVDRSGLIEAFHLRKAEDKRYFPPESLQRWNSETGAFRAKS